jgi:site-specific DNA-methyltransferase (adenine-specific)
MNQLLYGDNLEILRYDVYNNGKFLIENESVDVVYIDPPFNSNRDYNIIYGNDATAQIKAFEDTWSLIGVEEIEQMIEKEYLRYANIQKPYDVLRTLLRDGDRYDRAMYGYLMNMAVRISEIYRKLKPTGTFYLHCDQTANTYLRIILDCVFGRENMLNEIVWHYQTGGNSKRWFARKHDTIFFYAKEIKKHFFCSERVMIPRTEEVLKRIRSGVKGATRSEGETKRPHDVIIMSAINSMAKERLGYPTQKPLALLEILLQAATPQIGDVFEDGTKMTKKPVVMDVFCGCGTTIMAAQKLGFNWIGVDITYLSIDLIMKQRLLPQYYGLNGDASNYKEAFTRLKEEVNLYGIPKDLDAAKALITAGKVRKEFEKWAVLSVGGLPQEKKGADGGVDGAFFVVKNAQNLRHKGYISVKSGAVSVKDIRDFSAAIDFFESEIGVFVTLEEPTKPMLEFIATLPKFKSELHGDLPKITIIKVQDIIDDPFGMPSFIKHNLKQMQKDETDFNQNLL